MADVIHFPDRDTWDRYMREGFEDFLRRGMKQSDPNWLARTNGGNYVFPLVRASWAAWCASAWKLAHDAGAARITPDDAVAPPFSGAE